MKQIFSTGTLILLAFSMMSSTAGAQERLASGPPPLPFKTVDEFGVDLKTGRMEGINQQHISIGSGDSQIATSFRSVDGRDIRLNYAVNIESYLQSGSVHFSFNGISEKFASGLHGTTNSVVDYATALPTGSSLTRTLSGQSATWTFIDKHGMKVVATGGANAAQVLEYVEWPDGRRLNGDLSNNFGYRIMLDYDAGLATSRAVNLAVDYCAPSQATCVNPTQPERSATLFQAGFTHKTFTNATDGVTKYTSRYTNAGVITGYTTTCQLSICNGQLSLAIIVDRVLYYPESIRYPGSAADDVSIIYDYPNYVTRWHNYNRVLHRDIRVKSIAKNGVTANYTYEISDQSPPYTGELSMYYITATKSIDGVFVAEYKSLKLLNGPGMEGHTILLESKDALGRITLYGNSAVHQITSVRYPQGNSVFQETDDRNNVTEVIQKAKFDAGLPDLVTTYAYPSGCTETTRATCNKFTSVTDPKGNVTDYTYNDRGQVLTETKPAPTTGASRPKITNEYTMRTAYIKSSNGSPVPAGQPISLLTKTSTCITQSTCAGTTDEVVTEYDYGPTTGLNNLQVRGVAVTAVGASGQMETQRTCYQYNYFGEKIAETQPKGTGSICP